MKKIISVILIIFISASNFIYAVELNVNKKKENIVKFISNAPLEDFEGVTSKIDGYMIITTIDKLIGSEIYFEVDLNSLDTGIGLRNRHMRDNYLHTDKYPMTTFKGKIISSEKDSESKYKVVCEGDITIHGVSKKIKVNGYITTNNAGSYRINAKFSVALTDYKIEVPMMMFMKIDENIKLVLDFYMIEVND